jgi:hypothetical protein
VELVVNMLFAWRVVGSIGLQVQLPMKIEVDNKGAVDLANSWTATNRTRHIATRINFLRELKAQGTISVVWISNQFMSSDTFTKNVGGESFVRHRGVYVRDWPVAAGEGVGRAVTRNQGMKGIAGSTGSRKRSIL